MSEIGMRKVLSYSTDLKQWFDHFTDIKASKLET